MKERLLFGSSAALQQLYSRLRRSISKNFQIHGKGDEVSIAYEPGTFAGEDLGLVKYHFKLGAGKDSFRWM